MHNSNSSIAQHRELRIRYVERDTAIQDFVVKLLDCELSGDGSANRNDARREDQDG